MIKRLQLAFLGLIASGVFAYLSDNRPATASGAQEPKWTLDPVAIARGTVQLSRLRIDADDLAEGHGGGIRLRGFRRLNAPVRTRSDEACLC